MKAGLKCSAGKQLGALKCFFIFLYNLGVSCITFSFKLYANARGALSFALVIVSAGAGSGRVSVKVNKRE